MLVEIDTREESKYQIIREYSIYKALLVVVCSINLKKQVTFNCCVPEIVSNVIVCGMYA